MGLFNACLMATCFDANREVKDRECAVKPAFWSVANSHFGEEDSNITELNANRRHVGQAVPDIRHLRQNRYRIASGTV